jgi:enamine deaminase RidA (YjgF/YER057c/UK114 family)
MSRIEEKLKEMGIVIPEAAKPVAAYVPGVLENGYVYTSGQLPSVSGVVRKGKLGDNLTVEEGYEAAKICAINCLAVVKSLVGDLDKVERIVKVVGFVNSTLDCESQPKVINGASELLGKIFDEAGAHARSAVGVASLPLGACCEVEMIVKVKA